LWFESKPGQALGNIAVDINIDMAAARACISSSSTAAAAAAFGRGPQPHFRSLKLYRSTLQRRAIFMAAGFTTGLAHHAIGAIELASLAPSSSSSCRKERVRHRPAAAAAAAGAGAIDAADAVAAAAATTEALLAWMQQQECVVEGVQLEYSQGPQGQVWRELKACKVSKP
jgi:hypothetical protein